MPEQASLCRSGVPLDDPLEGHLLCHSAQDLASITPAAGLASNYLLHFEIFINFKVV